MTAGDPVTASVHIEAPPQRVFAFFTDPEKICRWLAHWAELDPQQGGRFALDIEGTPVRGRYLEIDPGHRLVLSWGHAGSDQLPPESSRVEITFSPEQGGTRIELLHRDLPAPQRPSHIRGWTVLLARLAKLDLDG